jgi:hypothetical protein
MSGRSPRAAVRTAAAAPALDRGLIDSAPAGEAAARAPAVDRRRLGSAPAGRAAARAPAGPTRASLIAVAVVLGLAGLLAGWRLGRPAALTRAAAVVRATYAGVDYRLLGIEITRRIPQPGGAVPASGVFEIVRLELRAADRRPHVVSSDLLTLEAGPAYYGVSSPDDIGLTDRGWGALTASTAVPAGSAVSVKAVFELPTGLAGRARSLHIGPFDYVDRAAATLPLPRPAGCCRAVAVAPLTSLGPSPVLGG